MYIFLDFFFEHKVVENGADIDKTASNGEHHYIVLLTMIIFKPLNFFTQIGAAVTITYTTVQSNTVDSLHSKSSSLEQEDNKHSLQSLEEQAEANISTIEDNTESISNVTGSPSSSELFANRKRKQDESSNEAPEVNKLRRLEH